MVKNLPTNEGDIRDMGLIPGLRRSPGKSYGQRNLAGCSPCGCKELDSIEQRQLKACVAESLGWTPETHTTS